MKRALAAGAVAALLVVAGIVVWTQSSGERSPLGALQTASDEPVTIDMHQGVPRFMQGEVQVEGATPADRSYAFLEGHSKLYAVEQPRREFEVAEVATTENLAHVHLVQQQDGIPVYGGAVTVHLDGSAVVSTVGSYLAEVPGLEPRIEAGAALETAQAEAGIAKGGETKPELTYFDADLLMTPAEQKANELDGETRLAWLVDVSGTDAEGRPVSKRAFVDAQSGQLLLAYDLIFTHAAARNLIIRTANGNAATNRFPCRQTNALDWFGPNGRLPNAFPDPEGHSAFQHVGTVYDYLFNTFHRHSYDGNERMLDLLLDAVETWLPAPNAAYWAACERFYFTNDMATLDMVAHEIAHGVTHHSIAGGLTYAFQSGAIHESVSDTFGVLIDSGNWILGEGSASTQYRDYADPRRSQQFTPRRGQPDMMPPEVFAATVDNGGVHQNSGIPNKAGYLMMQGGLHNRRVITPIGRLKTARLWYEVVDNWLATASQFQDFRNSMTSAARVWGSAGTNGFTPADACRVTNAFAAVELGPGDADCDGMPDSDETDADNDGVPDTDDNCDFVANPLQFDFDEDGRGTHCDDNESLTPVRPNLREAIERRIERFQRIEIPVIPCLERCEPGLPVQIRLEVDVPLEFRLLDPKGNVVAEGSSKEPIVFEPEQKLEYRLEILPKDLSLTKDQPFELELVPGRQ